MADERVTLDLHGANAPEGINLDDLERFVGAFRAALRAFWLERSGGSPRPAGGVEAAVHACTNLRVTALRAGSAVLELATPIAAGGTDQEPLDLEVRSSAIENLASLADAIENDQVGGDVAKALGRARKVLGADDGRFGMSVSGRSGRVEVTRDRVARWQDDAPPPASEAVTRVVGRLHGFELEGEPRFSVRGQDGSDWTCHYPPALEARLLAAVRSVVVVNGQGQRRGAKGTIAIEELDVVPELGSNPMFSSESADERSLASDQGVDRPQPLDGLRIVDLPDDERDAFLAAIFDE